MPRRLLRDRTIVADDWVYAAEWADAKAPATRNAAQDVHPPRVIVGLDQWIAERDAWLLRTVALGVVLLPEHKVELLAPDLERLSLVACSFPGPSEGRGYTQGRLLRERYDFKRELRATGYVRIDQLFFLARCGFNSFELADNDLAAADAAFATFTAAYQPANDRGLAHKLAHNG